MIISVQAAAETKPRGSVKKMIANNSRVVFDEEWIYNVGQGHQGMYAVEEEKRNLRVRHMDPDQQA